MIAIIDYGMGNLFSVEKAFVKLGAKVIVTNDEKVILQADKVVLPGVGAFGDCMNNLEQSGLIPAIKEVVNSGKPFLGICLGLQLLFEESEESPGVKGLGIFRGKVQKIIAPDLKIPHMGWNNLKIEKKNKIFDNLEENPRYYFLHSYYFECENKEDVIATATYGEKFDCMINHKNIYGIQCHPEKSHHNGMQLLKNFGEL